jgi:transposase
MPPSFFRPHRLPRPWAPLTDAEWAALRPFLDRAAENARQPGRPIAHLRDRVDAIFQAVTSGLPWSQFRSRVARADTLHRQFRRLIHAGAWEALLRAVAARAAPPPLAAVADWVAAGWRRARRLVGLGGLVLARRLGLSLAMPGPPWLLPDPDLSGTLQRLLPHLLLAPAGRAGREVLRSFRALLRASAGRRRIPRCLNPL